MATKGLKIATLANPTGAPDIADAFAKIDPAEVHQSTTGEDVNCVVNYYYNEAAYDAKKPCLSFLDAKYMRVTLGYTVEEWGNLSQPSAYDKLKAKMEAP